MGLTGLDESGRQDLNLRPLGPEISGVGSHVIIRVPLSTQAAGIPGSGVEASSHLVSGNEPISNASFTFHAQNSELNCAYLTVREVAERLRVCRATAYRMIDRGQLQALRVSSGAIRVIADASRGLQTRPASGRNRSRRS